MKKLLMLLFLCLFVTSLISAKPTLTNIQAGELTLSPTIPTAIPQARNHDFYIHVINSSQIFRNGLTCFLHIYDEQHTGAHVYTGNSSNFVYNKDLEFEINNTVFEKKGEYSYKFYCNTSGQTGMFEKTFYVTKNGLDPAEDFFTLFIYALAIFCWIGLFYTLFIGLAKLVTTETTFYDVVLSWAFYILLLIVIYLSENYLISTFVEDISNQFSTLLVFTNGVLPAVSLVISMFVRSTKKKKLLSVNELAGRRFS